MKTELRGKELHLFLTGMVDEAVCTGLTETIIKANNGGVLFESDMFRDKPALNHSIERIVLHIASPGGEVLAGMLLTNTILTSKIPVDCIISAAYSMGFIIAVACRHRLAYPMATMLHHDTSTMAMGNLQNIKETIEVAEKERNMMDKMVKERTKISQDELDIINKQKLDKTYFVDEALEKGIIHGIVGHVDHECDCNSECEDCLCKVGGTD